MKLGVQVIGCSVGVRGLHHGVGRGESFGVGVQVLYSGCHMGMPQKIRHESNEAI